MEFSPMIRWISVGVIALLILIWHLTQNKKFAAHIKKQGGNDILSRRLLGLAFDRSLQLFFALGILLAVVVFFDQRLAAQQTKIIELTGEKDILTEQLTAQVASPQSLLYPGGEELQAKLDQIKEKFEPLFINYYYLKRCNLVSPNDFHLMNSALLYELSRIDGPSSARDTIIQAAKGSHDEMYAEAPCTKEATNPVKTNVDRYLQSVAANIQN